MKSSLLYTFLYLLGKHTALSGSDDSHEDGTMSMLIFFAKCIIWTTTVAVIIRGILEKGQQSNKGRCSVNEMSFIKEKTLKFQV